MIEAIDFSHADFDEQRRSGFRYQYSNYQIEYSRNLLFEIGGHMEALATAALFPLVATLDEDTTFRSDSDTFGLAIVIGVADRLINGGTFIQIHVKLLAHT